MNQMKFDKEANSDILIGYSNIEGLKKIPFQEWFENEYTNYQPDIEVLNRIDKESFTKNTNITLVMGNWCSDSQQQVPRLVKILESIDYPVNSIKIINVDTQKNANGTGVNQLDIIKIPTIILSRKNLEIGRIIESPEISLEKDLLKILSN